MGEGGEEGQKEWKESEMQGGNKRKAGKRRKGRSKGIWILEMKDGENENKKRMEKRKNKT